MIKSQEKKSFKELQQERINFLMYEVKSFLERNGVTVKEWTENTFKFESNEMMFKAVDIYKPHISHWNSILAHKMKFSKADMSMNFVTENSKKKTPNK